MRLENLSIALKVAWRPGAPSSDSDLVQLEQYEIGGL